MTAHPARTDPGDTAMTAQETPDPIVVQTPHLKGGASVVCHTHEEVRRAQGMDDFAAWLRNEVLT